MQQFPKCYFCGKQFPNMSFLELHATTHVNEKPFKCDDSSCFKRFSQQNLSRIHKELVHGSNPIFDTVLNPNRQCSKCDRKFETKSELVAHIQTFKHPERIHKCLHCDKKFLSIAQRNIHAKYVHGNREKIHNCGIKGCSAKFVRKQAAWQHRKRVHCEERKFLCGVGDCGMKFKSGGELKAHNLRRHQPRINVECEICHKAMSTFSLNRHMKIVHGEQLKLRKFLCGVCLKGFKHQSTLNRHIASHTRENRVKCKLCGKEVDQAYMKFHLLSAAHVGETRFPCPLCDKRYQQLMPLKIHIREKHTPGGDKHPCPKCGKVLSSRANMFRHLRALHTHREVKPSCYFCYKQVTKDGLPGHLAMHTTERRYKCEVCRMSFPKKFHLLKHMSLHTGEKIYKCKYPACQSQFASYYSLRQHRLLHEGGKVREARGTRNCPVCHIQFYSNVSLTRHIKTTHPTQEKKIRELETTCYFCKVISASRQSLEAHIRRHIDEKPFKCEICRKFLISASCTTQRCIINRSKHKQKVGLFDPGNGIYVRTKIRILVK